MNCCSEFYSLCRQMSTRHARGIYSRNNYPCNLFHSYQSTSLSCRRASCTDTPSIPPLIHSTQGRVTMSYLVHIQNEYQQLKALNLSLNIKRGHPADANFDLCLDLLDSVGRNRIVTDIGVDIRNYPNGCRSSGYSLRSDARPPCHSCR